MLYQTISRPTEKGFNKALNEFISNPLIKVMKIHYSIGVQGWSVLIEYEESI